MAPKQKEALFRLVFGILVFGSIGLAFLFMEAGWAWLFMLLVIVVAAPFGVYGWWRYMTGRDTEEDERDRILISKVSKHQNYATILTLAGWMLFYVSTYSRNDEVPHLLVPLLICSTAFVNAMAENAGILVAYWLANRKGTRP